MTVCTWCVAGLGHPASQLRIDYPGPDYGGPDPHETWAPGGRNYDAQFGRSPRKLELIEEALEHGWRVWLNGNFIIEPPVATWRGDPVCAAHLAEEIERDRNPQTVRMAQWRR